MATVNSGFNSTGQLITAPQGESLSAMFIKLDGIEGESKDSKHAGWTDVVNQGWGITQSASTQHGAGITAGKGQVEAFWFDHYVDKTTASVCLKCLQGAHVPKAQFHGARISGDMGTYFDFTMEDVIVTSVAFVGALYNPRLMLRVGLAFAKMSMETKAQNEKGALVAGSNLTWDIKKNAG